MKSERITLLGSKPQFGTNGPSAANMNLHMQDFAYSCIPAFIVQSELFPELLLPASFLTILRRLRKNMHNVGKTSHHYRALILIPRRMLPAEGSVSELRAEFLAELRKKVGMEF